jgi:hypothetical protein
MTLGRVNNVYIMISVFTVIGAFLGNCMMAFLPLLWGIIVLCYIGRLPRLWGGSAVPFRFIPGASPLTLACQIADATGH